jgi:hypothetical protein
MKKFFDVVLFSLIFLLTGCDDGKVQDCFLYTTRSLSFYVKQSQDESIYNSGTRNYGEQTHWNDFFENGVIKSQFREHLRIAERRILVTIPDDLCPRDKDSVCYKNNIESSITNACIKVKNGKVIYR